jgi:hypothetical protein
MASKCRAVNSKLIWIAVILSLFMTLGVAKPKKGGGKSNPIPMDTIHSSSSELAIQPQASSDGLYSDGQTSDPDGEFGISITVEGGVYNMTMQCPVGSVACQEAFYINLSLRPGQPAGCDLLDELGTARMTIWVYDLPECEAGTTPSTPPEPCLTPNLYTRTARAQIRQLDEHGGALEGGTGVELNWDPSLVPQNEDFASHVEVTPLDDGSWDIEGFDAVAISGKGRRKTTCVYDASFLFNTLPQLDSQ